MYICIYKCIYMCVCIYIYIYIKISIHEFITYYNSNTFNKLFFEHDNQHTVNEDRLFLMT